MLYCAAVINAKMVETYIFIKECSENFTPRGEKKWKHACSYINPTSFRWLQHKPQYSETRLLRTLKGNEKRYVVTIVRSIQNAIFLTGRPVPRVHANDLPRKMLLRPECRSLSAFRTVKSPCRASWTWKRAGKLTSKLKGWMTCLWSEKKETKERARKCSWKENWYVISDFVSRSVRLIRKKCTCFPIDDVRDRRRVR